MATRPTEALTVIPQYNIEPYDEATNPYGFDNGGHIYNHLQSFRYVVQIEQYLTDLTGETEAAFAALAAEMDADAMTAELAREQAVTKAGEAAISATDAANAAARQLGTSTTSRTPAIGSLQFTTQAGKAFDVGAWLTIQSRGTAGRWAYGKVTAYAGTSVTVAVEAIGPTVSAGTDWNLLVSGGRGATGGEGPAGPAQDISGKANLSGATFTGRLDLQLGVLGTNGGAANFALRNVWKVAQTAAMTLTVSNLVEGNDGQVNLTYTAGALSFSGVDRWVVTEDEVSASFVDTTVGGTGLVAGAIYQFVFSRVGTYTVGRVARVY